METLLIILLVVSFSGFVAGLVLLHRLLGSKKSAQN
jgi:hypothetical protein